MWKCYGGVLSTLNNVIEEELLIRRKHYLEAPASIIEHYNIEQQNIKAYNGRQLLEMLQNADDASEQAEIKSILIKIENDELTISNNGEPFSEDGFRSIIYSNLSPKTMQQNKIGQKGLGFRSILSWADEVIIESGGARLGFSEKIAQEFLKNIFEESQSVTDFIHKHSKSKYPIATLRVPKLLQKTDSKTNYETTITVQLKPGMVNDVLDQLETVVNKETLVFLNNTNEIIIDTPKGKSKYTKHAQNNQVTITFNSDDDDQVESKTWNVNKVNGEYQGKNYELAIAWNEALDDKENVLFSYFKTKVRFPFPALIHGTFELTDDRNQLVTDPEGHNEFLTLKLSELLIETAINIASQDDSASYKPITLLNIDFENIDAVLTKYNFKDCMYSKIKESNIYPNVNGKYIRYRQKPVFYDYPIANFIEGSDVNNLLLHSIDERLIRFLKDIGNYRFNISHLFEIISKRTIEKKYSEAAKLIFLILSNQTYINEISADDSDITRYKMCFTDTDDKHIPWNSNIFIQPQDNKEFKLPRNINIRFINHELVDALLIEFQPTDINALINKLTVLNVKIYDFTVIALTLIDHYVQENVKLNDVVKLHFYLYRLYKREARLRDRIEPVSEHSIPVITLSRKIKMANEVYFGKYFNNELIDQLYSYDRSRILASPALYEFGKEEIKTLINYFAWLGVKDLPRYSVITLARNSKEISEYQEHVLRNFDYKKSMTMGTKFKNFSELISELNSVYKIEVGCFDGIAEILSKAKHDIIFKWIKVDDRLRKTLESDNEQLSTASVRLDIKKQRNYRDINCQDIRSYTRWLFSTKQWLPVESTSTRAAPGKCCLSKTITSEFSPFVEKPKIDLAKIAEKLELTEDAVENYLVLVGVHREISSFPIGVLYEMLFSLSESDKEGKVAKSIYREIINNFDESKLDDLHPAYIKFKQDGKVFSQKNNESGYYPVTDARYIDTKTVGNNILKRFPLVCIDRKRGNKKVKRLFGVEQLENIAFKLIEDPILHPLANQFTEEIQRFKGLVYALRMRQDIKHEIRNRLKRLRIILVQDVKAEFMHNQVTERFELEQYEFIVTKTKSTYYLLIPKEMSGTNELRQIVAFNESIAEIFTTLINTEEHRSFIRELYSTIEIYRESLLLSEMQEDSNAIIIESNNQLEIIDDIRLSFWRSFALSIKKNNHFEIKSEGDLNNFFVKKLKLSSEMMDIFTANETYGQFNDLSIQSQLYEIFIQFSADYKVFSRHFTGLEFSNVFKNKYEDLKHLHANEFAYHLFNRLKPEPMESRRSYFDTIDAYNALAYKVTDGFLPDINIYFTKSVLDELAIKLNDQISAFTYQSLINQSVQELMAEGIIIPDKVLERKTTQSLLLFNDIDEVKKLIDKYKTEGSSNPAAKQIKVRGKNIEYENYKSLLTKFLEGLDINKIKIKSTKTLTVDEKNRSDHTPGNANNRRVNFKSKDDEQVGFIAELLCYHKLCAKHGEESIKWVSENAYRAYPDKFITGEAGKGYDLEIIENGKIRYIEIKGTSNVNEGIHMTSNEIATALEFPDKYDLLIVEGPLTNEPLLRLIKSPFKFKKDESLFTNDKLKVFNDNYILKFKWDE